MRIMAVVFVELRVVRSCKVPLGLCSPGSLARFPRGKASSLRLSCDPTPRLGFWRHRPRACPDFEIAEPRDGWHSSAKTLTSVVWEHVGPFLFVGLRQSAEAAAHNYPSRRYISTYHPQQAVPIYLSHPRSMPGRADQFCVPPVRPI